MATEDKFIDYYALFCVPSDASTDQIKKSYKKHALKKHPDRNLNNPNAGAEFAILVEAKEILTNEESRTKYDRQYKVYQNQLQQRAQDRLREAQMGVVRKEQIRKLVEAEDRVRNRNRSDFYKKHIYKTKQDSIQEELEKFRKLIQGQQRNKLKQLKDEERMRKKEKKLQNRSLIVKLDTKQCTKAYTKEELKSIFKIYGKIVDINMTNNEKYIGAEIVFSKSKYVLKALNDEKELKNEFYLTLIGYDEDKKEEAMRMDKEEKWKELIRNRQHLNYEEYEQLVWNKVQKFIRENTVKNNVHHNDNSEDVDIMDID